jgi:hypothetical protein
LGCEATAGPPNADADARMRADRDEAIVGVEVALLENKQTKKQTHDTK